MRVGTKLTLAVGTVLVCVGIGYGIFYFVAKQHYVATTLTTRAEQTALFVEAARSEGLTGDALARALTRTATPMGLRQLRLSGKDGEVALAWESAPNLPWPDLPPAQATTQSHMLTDGKVPALLHVRPLPRGEHLALVVTYTDQDQVLFSSSNISIALVAMVTLALLVVVSTLARQNIAVPLSRLTRSVERFGEGEMNVRHPEEEPGEINLLASRFNHMAETISEQTDELVREREYERSVVRNVFSGIVGLDREGLVSTWNQSMVRRYAYPPDEVLGKPVEFLCPKVFDRSTVEAARSLIDGKVDAFDREGVHHETTRVGPRIMDIRGRAIADGKGGVHGAVLAVEDHTDQLRLTEQLRHTEKLATVGQLAAGLAHEIGTPLNVISGRAEFVLKKLPEDTDLRRHLTRIIGQIDRISGIVSQMLVFARKQPPNRKRVELAQLVETVTDLLSLQMEKANIRVDSQVEPGLSLNADPDQLQQVIMNVLINATQAMVSGGHIRIRASTLCVPDRNSATFVRTSFTDTGPGMTKAVAKRIFDPFFTTKEPGRGTGMGLTVSHGIVNSHGGWIEVESKPGKGSTFTVYLPQEESPENESREFEDEQGEPSKSAAQTGESG